MEPVADRRVKQEEIEVKYTVATLPGVEEFSSVSLIRQGYVHTGQDRNLCVLSRDSSAYLLSVSDPEGSRCSVRVPFINLDPDQQRGFEQFVGQDLSAAEVRIRETRSAGQLERLVTIKGVGLLARLEVEGPIGDEDYSALGGFVCGREFEKLRCNFELASTRIEVDLFLGQLRGLILAEIEASSTEQAQNIVPPNWFGTDVTLDPAYKGQSLAERGTPPGARLIGLTDDQLAQFLQASGA